MIDVSANYLNSVGKVSRMFRMHRGGLNQGKD